MKMNEIKQVARERGIKPGRLKKEDLVRVIQQQEGNPQCFNTAFSQDCGQVSCLWRGDCQ